LFREQKRVTVRRSCAIFLTISHSICCIFYKTVDRYHLRKVIFRTKSLIHVSNYSNRGPELPGIPGPPLAASNIWYHNNVRQCRVNKPCQSPSVAQNGRLTHLETANHHHHEKNNPYPPPPSQDYAVLCSFHLTNLHHFSRRLVDRSTITTV
jgi:hypothetical protein